MRRPLLLVSFASLLLVSGMAGCRARGERCAKCGMLVEAAPRWIAGLTNATGRQQRFCAPRCMFAWLRSPGGEGARDAWVTEYYGQRRMSVEDVLFVAGSDVVGPMGASLVPVAGEEAARRFLHDHHGARIVAAGRVTRALLRDLRGR